MATMAPATSPAWAVMMSLDGEDAAEAIRDLDHIRDFGARDERELADADWR